MTAQKVQVFALGVPKADVVKEQRRWSVRWRVDGRDRMRKFKSKAQAERLRSQLLVAAGGLPAEWVRVDLSFFEWAQHLVYPDALAPSMPRWTQPHLWPGGSIATRSA